MDRPTADNGGEVQALGETTDAVDLAGAVITNYCP